MLFQPDSSINTDPIHPPPPPKTLTPVPPLCVYSCVWNVSVCELGSRWLLQCAVYTCSKKGKAAGNACSVCVRSDQEPRLPARCDSDAASIQSEARLARTPSQVSEYLFCTIFEVFLNIIHSERYHLYYFVFKMEKTRTYIMNKIC